MTAASIRQLLEYTQRFCDAAQRHARHARGANRARIERLADYLHARRSVLLETLRDCEDEVWGGVRQSWPAPVSHQALGRLVSAFERGAGFAADTVICSGLHLDDYMQLACEAAAAAETGRVRAAFAELTQRSRLDRADLLRELYPEGIGKGACAGRHGAARHSLQ